MDRSSTTNDDDGTIVGQTGEEREHMNREPFKPSVTRDVKPAALRELMDSAPRSRSPTRR